MPTARAWARSARTSAEHLFSGIHAVWTPAETGM
jgi:hypothetical protein